MNIPPASAPAAESVTALVEAYESARAERGAISLAEFLPPPDDSLYLPALAELVRVDMEYAWNAGVPKSLNDYRRQFPILFADAARLCGVAFEEYRQRRLAGQAVVAEEYRQGYGVDVSGWPVDVPASDRTQAYPELHPITDFRVELPAAFPVVGSEFVGFHLVAELGRGAFGRVYLARQGDLADRLVALKVSRDAFRESQTLARLQHTNVMPIYSVHHAEPFHAVCMPYFPSVTLANLTHDMAGRETMPESAVALMETIREQSRRGGEKRPAPESPAKPEMLWAPFCDRHCIEAVVWIGARLADGLAHAHERGIIHRDLKPANILLTEDGQPLILDFNLADDPKRPAGERAFLGGTLPYMAPEQLRAFLDRKPHSDPRGDIYALGLILFELLTRRRPFPDRTGDWETTVKNMLQDRAGPLPQLRPLNKAVTPAVEAIIRKCLEADPANRYQTARQLHDDLQRQFEHRPLLHQREPSARERARKFFRRNPGLLSATRLGIVAGLMLLAAGASAVVWSQRALTLQAQGQWRHFRDQTRPAFLMRPRPEADRDQIDESNEQLTALLDRYDVLTNPAWLRAPAVRRLPDADRNELRNAAGELTFLVGRNLTRKALHDPRRKELLAEALEYNRRAENTYSPGSAPRVLWRHRAEVYQLLDEPRDAERERKDAEAVPLRTARDFLLEAIFLTESPDRPDRATILPLLNEAERLTSGDANLWFGLGLAYRDVGQMDRAITCLTISLALDRDRPWTWAARGEVRVETGEVARAVEDLDRALELEPGWAHALRNRALAREKAGDLAGAETDLTELLKQHPERVDLLHQRARVRQLRKDAAGAKQDLVALLASKPQTVAGWLARATAQADPRAALADLDEALARDPDHLLSLMHKTKTLSERLNRPKDAIAVLSHAVKTHPDAAEAWAGRAVLHARLGERDPALADAREALRHDRSPIFVYQAANAFALTSPKAVGDRQEAMKLLAEAFRRDPKLLDLVDGDPDLAPLNADAQFRSLIDAARRILK